jgi:hypothetical protein
MNRSNRQATYACGIDSLESIPGLLKRLQIRAQFSNNPKFFKTKKKSLLLKFSTHRIAVYRQNKIVKIKTRTFTKRRKKSQKIYAHRHCTDKCRRRKSSVLDIKLFMISDAQEDSFTKYLLFFSSVSLRKCDCLVQIEARLTLRLHYVSQSCRGLLAHPDNI